MRVSDEIIQRSFDLAGIDRRALHAVLRDLCPAILKGSTRESTAILREQWSTENPTRNCCYFVSEMVFWFCAPVGSTPMAVAIDGDVSVHRYTLWPDGTIVDLTCDQFTDYASVRYERGVYKPYMQTGARGPSQRARLLASKLDQHVVIAKTMHAPRKEQSLYGEDEEAQ